MALNNLGFDDDLDFDVDELDFEAELDDIDLDDSDLDLGQDDAENSGIEDIDGITSLPGMENDVPSDADVDREKNIADGKKTRKKAWIMMACGVVLLILIFVICGAVLGGNKDTKEPDLPAQVQQSKPVVNSQSQNTNSQAQTVKPSNNPVNTVNGWQQINEADIAFNSEYIQSAFTVTDIKHYVKQTNNSKEIEIKSVLTGSLGGLTGTYELEIPYSKGRRLPLGSSFNVSVQIGEYNGSKVIGEIVIM